MATKVLCDYSELIFSTVLNDIAFRQSIYFLSICAFVS